LQSDATAPDAGDRRRYTIELRDIDARLENDRELVCGGANQAEHPMYDVQTSQGL